MPAKKVEKNKPSKMKDSKAKKVKKAEPNKAVKSVAKPKAQAKAKPTLSVVAKAKTKVKAALVQVTKIAKQVQAKDSIASAGKKQKPIKGGSQNNKEKKLVKAVVEQVEPKVKQKLLKSEQKIPATEISTKASGSSKKSQDKSAKLAASLEKLKNRCRESACEQESLLSGYCRLHYIKNWKRIKKKELILSGGQLDLYVEELVSKYPDKYLDAIENDLATEKEWIKVISDLELSSSEDDFIPEDEDMVPETASRRSTSFDDENDDIY